jgi:hypothetical protein
MSPVLTPTNGSKPHVENHTWLQQTVRQVFSNFNWEDQTPEVQEMRAASQADDAEPLSLKITVSQFFGAINWDGNQAIAQPVDHELTFIEDISMLDIPESSDDDDGFTLDDFSGLF